MLLGGSKIRNEVNSSVVALFIWRSNVRSSVMGIVSSFLNLFIREINVN